MTELKLSEAKAHLGRYLERAARGESFIIMDRNRPKAQLVPIDEKQKGVLPKIGLFEGMGNVPDDFNDPLPEFEKDFYGE